MTDNPPPVPDETQTKSKFQTWMNEVLDTRDKNAKDAADAEAKRKAEEDAKRPKPFNLLSSLFGE